MKKLLLVAFLLTFAAGTAIAQQGGPGSQGGGKGQPGNSQNGGNPGNPVERLTELLGLDEAQVAAIELIFEDNQALREEERAKARAAAEENRAITHGLILAELTDDQKALYEEHQQQREALKQALEELRNERGFGGGGGRGTGTGDCNG
jgi:Spy/CpxP family protein refolding chaperone